MAYWEHQPCHQACGRHSKHPSWGQMRCRKAVCRSPRTCSVSPLCWPYLLFYELHIRDRLLHQGYWSWAKFGRIWGHKWWFFFFRKFQDWARIIQEASRVDWEVISSKINWTHGKWKNEKNLENLGRSPLPPLWLGFLSPGGVDFGISGPVTACQKMTLNANGAKPSSSDLT